MGKRYWQNVAGLGVAFGLVVALAGNVQAQRAAAGQGPQKEGKPVAGPAAGPAEAGKNSKQESVDPTTLRGRLVGQTRLKSRDVDKVLKALGPAILDLLKTGQEVQVDGLGTFRVVAVPAHRDLVEGRPGTIPGRKYIEFTAVGDVTQAANDADVVPAEVVPPYTYNPLPNQVQSLHTGSSRIPRQKIR